MINEQASTDRLIEVAEALLDKTRKGEVSWRTMDDEDAFLYSGSRSSLVIDFNSRRETFELRLLNQRGTVVETLSTAEVSTPTDPWASGPAEWNDTLAHLHDAARRSALDIDGLIESTLADLREEPPF